MTRAFAALAAVGAVTSPPLAVTASLLMLLSFAAVADAGPRLLRALRTPLGRGLLALVGALLAAALIGLWRTPPAAVGRELLGWRHLLLIPVALAAFDSADSQRRFALVLVGTAVAGAVASLLAANTGFARDGYPPGILLRNPVTQALALAVGALLAGLLAVTQTQWARRWRLLLAAVSLLLMANVAFAQSGRSGFVALMVSIATAALLLVRGRARLVALLAALMLGSALYAASPNLQQRFGLALSELRQAEQLAEYSSMGMRVVIWKTSLEVATQRPLLGLGLGGFPAAYAEQIRGKYSEGWKAIRVSDPHNQYLFLWIEAGVLGLLGFAALLAGALRQPAEMPYRAAGIALLAAWCVTSVFSSHFQTFSEGHLIALLLGVFLAPAAAGTAVAGDADRPVA